MFKLDSCHVAFIIVTEDVFKLDSCHVAFIIVTEVMLHL